MIITKTVHFPFALGKSCKCMTRGLSTREAGRGHATPHMPVETAKCWWLLKIEPSLSLKPAQTPLKNGQKPLAKLYNSPKNSRAPTAWRSTQTAQLPLPPAHAFGSIFSNHQHFAVSTGICGVACPLPASRVDKPLV